MYYKQKFLDNHQEFQGYRLVEEKDLKVGTKLLYVKIRGWTDGEIFFDQQVAELRQDFRNEGIFNNLGLTFLNIFLPNSSPSGRYEPVREVEVLAKEIDEDPANKISGRIFLVSQTE